MLILLQIAYFSLMAYTLFRVVELLLLLIRATFLVVRDFMSCPTPEKIAEIRERLRMANEEVRQEELDNPAPIVTFPRLAFWAGVAVWFHYFFYAV